MAVALGNPDPTDLARSAEGRAGLYGLLALLFRRPLDATTLHAMQSDELAAALTECGIQIDELLATDNLDLLELLAVDFTQLFHGPRQHLPPYESVQTGHGDSELYGAVTEQVRRVFEAHGFEPGSNELPDHLSVELQFMAALAQAEATAWANGQAAEARALREEQSTFLKEHLGCWAPAFGRQVQTRAETRLYRGLGALLAEFVTDDQQDILARSAHDEGYLGQQATIAEVRENDERGSQGFTTVRCGQIRG